MRKPKSHCLTASLWSLPRNGDGTADCNRYRRFARPRPRDDVGLARQGHNVVIIGHIDTDIAEVEAATSGSNVAGQILPLVADLQRPADCDRVVGMTLQRFGGGVRILLSSAFSR